MKAIRVHETGGPEALRLEDVPIPVAGKGEALVKIEAAGINYTDIYRGVKRVNLQSRDRPRDQRPIHQ